MILFVVRRELRKEHIDPADFGADGFSQSLEGSEEVEVDVLPFFRPRLECLHQHAVRQISIVRRSHVVPRIRTDHARDGTEPIVRRRVPD
ncbi:MAG: hypothetical protein IID36_06795 [Planctomycetes bacterium]|nr:hypothetical protein [Planctomycetota bacterium]